MKKYVLYFSLFIVFILIIGCNGNNSEEKSDKGEFFLGQFGADFTESTYHLVIPIKWTGDSPIKMKSIELIKKDANPVTYEEDGIKYEFYGADPLKSSGIYNELDIGKIKDIRNLEIDGEGKIVLKLTLKNVDTDTERRLKVTFNVDGEEREEIVEWKTLELLNTMNN